MNNTQSDISYPYAISCVRATESTFLTPNTWSRLWEAPIDDCYQLLTDVGYGSGANNRHDIDELTQVSVTDAREFIASISPEPEWTNLFVYRVDGHNIKTILKGLMEREDVEKFLLSGGTIPIDTLLTDFEQDRFENFPTQLRLAVESFDPDEKPDILSAQIDASVFEQIFSVLSVRKLRNELLEHYFKTRVDLINVTSVIRARHLSWGENQIRPFLLSNGNIPRSTLLEAVSSANDEQAIDLLATGEYSTQIRTALEKYYQDKNIINLETKFERLTFEIIHNDYTNSYGIAPIVNYLLQKEFEARALRLLFVYKRLNREISLEELGVL